MKKKETTLTDDMIRELCTICTRDEAGRHFTSTSFHWEALESMGLIEIYRPIHPTGIPYSQEHYMLEVTEAGQDEVLARPDLHPTP